MFVFLRGIAYNIRCTITDRMRTGDLPLSHSFAATSIGIRIVADVRSTLQLRKETTGEMETNLTIIVDGCNQAVTEDALNKLNLGCYILIHYTFVMSSQFNQFIHFVFFCVYILPSDCVC